MADAAAAPPRFEMRGIRKAFGATVALDGVDLSVAAGESLRARRPERRRQEHADERSSSGALQPDAGDDVARRRSRSRRATRSTRAAPASR